MPDSSPPTDPNERGFVICLFMVFAAILMMSLAFAVDIGRAHDQQRQIQIAADAASLAALGSLGESSSYADMLATITTIAEANGVSLQELMGSPPRCGIWSDGAFVPQTASLCDSSTTAVEVSINRSLPAQFARLLNRSTFDLTARAVSYRPPASNGSCIRPFGVENSFLSRLGLPAGETFSIRGNQGSGNWGKLDIGGNMSSGTQYTAMMQNNVCHQDVAVGNPVSVGTGNAQIEQVFQTLLDDSTPPRAAENMVIALTSDFGSGNSSVVIERFIKVDLLAQSGTGSRWQATFRIVEWDAKPEPPSQPMRQLVK
jgi:Putative Flp pilus-assembly TadE/G-like